MSTLAQPEVTANLQSRFSRYQSQIQKLTFQALKKASQKNPKSSKKKLSPESIEFVSLIQQKLASRISKLAGVFSSALEAVKLEQRRRVESENRIQELHKENLYWQKMNEKIESQINKVDGEKIDLENRLKSEIAAQERLKKQINLGDLELSKKEEQIRLQSNELRDLRKILEESDQRIKQVEVEKDVVEFKQEKVAQDLEEVRKEKLQTERSAEKEIRGLVDTNQNLEHILKNEQTRLEDLKREIERMKKKLIAKDFIIQTMRARSGLRDETLWSEGSVKNKPGSLVKLAGSTRGRVGSINDPNTSSIVGASKLGRPKELFSQISDVNDLDELLVEQTPTADLERDKPQRNSISPIKDLPLLEDHSFEMGESVEQPQQKIKRSSTFGVIGGDSEVDRESVDGVPNDFKKAETAPSQYKPVAVNVKKSIEDSKNPFRQSLEGDTQSQISGQIVQNIITNNYNINNVTNSGVKTLRQTVNSQGGVVIEDETRVINENDSQNFDSKSGPKQNNNNDIENLSNSKKDQNISIDILNNPNALKSKTNKIKNQSQHGDLKILQSSNNNNNNKKTVQKPANLDSKDLSLKTPKQIIHDKAETLELPQFNWINNPEQIKTEPNSEHSKKLQSEISPSGFQDLQLSHMKNLGPKSTTSQTTNLETESTQTKTETFLKKNLSSVKEGGNESSQTGSFEMTKGYIDETFKAINKKMTETDYKGNKIPITPSEGSLNTEGKSLSQQRSEDSNPFFEFGKSKPVQSLIRNDQAKKNKRSKKRGKHQPARKKSDLTRPTTLSIPKLNPMRSTCFPKKNKMTVFKKHLIMLTNQKQQMSSDEDGIESDFLSEDDDITVQQNPSTLNRIIGHQLNPNKISFGYRKVSMGGMTQSVSGPYRPHMPNKSSAMRKRGSSIKKAVLFKGLAYVCDKTTKFLKILHISTSGMMLISKKSLKVYLDLPMQRVVKFVTSEKDKFLLQIFYKDPNDLSSDDLQTLHLELPQCERAVKVIQAKGLGYRLMQRKSLKIEGEDLFKNCSLNIFPRALKQGFLDLFVNDFFDDWKTFFVCQVDKCLFLFPANRKVQYKDYRGILRKVKIYRVISYNLVKTSTVIGLNRQYTFVVKIHNEATQLIFSAYSKKERRSWLGCI